MREHLRISTLRGKRVKGDDDSAIKEQYLLYNHLPDFEDFSILTRNSNNFKITLMESLLIDRDHPLLNEKKQSLSLEIFLSYLTHLAVALSFLSCVWYVLNKADCKFFIQHLVLNDDYFISWNVGRTKINLFTSNKLHFLWRKYWFTDIHISKLED